MAKRSKKPSNRAAANKLKRKSDRSLQQRVQVEAGSGFPAIDTSAADVLAQAKQLLQSGNLRFGEYLLERVAQQLPELAATYIIRAEYLLQIPDVAAAEPYLAKALERDEQGLSLQFLQSKRLCLLSRHDEALPYLKKALALAPGNASLYNELGVCYTEMGENKKAIAAFAKAVQIDPLDGQAHWNRALLSRGPVDESSIQALDKLTRQPGLKPRALAGIHFSIARGHQSHQRFELEFEQLKIANRKIHEKKPWNASAELDMLARVEEIFSATHSFDYGVAPVPSSQPILIVGMPRTGSTLVEQILASHSRITATGESNLFKHGLIDAMTHMGLRQQHWTVVSRDRHREFGEHLHTAIARQEKLFSVGGAVYTEKTLDNFESLGVLMSLYPHLKVVNVERHPLDICVSCYQILFNDNLNYCYSLEDIAHKYLLYQRYMALWSRLFPDRILTLQYESLVARQEQESRRLLDYCDLPWEEECLHFYRATRSVATASVDQVRQPMYKDACDRWRVYSPYLGEAARILGVEI